MRHISADVAATRSGTCPDLLVVKMVELLSVILLLEPSDWEQL